MRKASDYARMKLDLLRSRTLGVMEVLYSVQSLHGLFALSRQPLEEKLFLNFVQEPLRRHPELQALAWSPLVKQTERKNFEQSIRQNSGNAAYQIFDLNAAGERQLSHSREHYVPLTFLAPLDANMVAQGFDLASEPRRCLALQRACDSGEPFATSPLRLVQETEGQLGCLIVLPVYHAAAVPEKERGEQLAGYVTAAFRITDMVDAFLNEDTDPQWQVQVAVFDKNDAAQLICKRGAPLLEGSEHIATEWLEFAGARWRVSVPIIHGTDGLTAPSSSGRLPYRHLFENAMVGMFQTSPEGTYLIANRSMAHMYGYPSPEALMVALSDIGAQLYVDPGRRSEFVKLLKQHDSIAGFESQVRRHDGTLLWISEKARGIRDAEGRLLYYEGIVEDITEQKLARDALNRACVELQERLDERTNQLARANAALSVEIEERKRAEKTADSANEAKSVFLSHMSHEIRTPLNAVIGYTQILQRDPHLTREQQGILQSLTAGSHHLMGLVEHLLDLSKIESGSMEVRSVPFELGGLVKMIESMFQHRCQQKRLRLHVTPLSDDCTVMGDEGLLRQVLINLLSNAVKFTDLGMVSLDVRPSGNDQWRFEVADTGIGIEAELQSQIFEPFQQSQAGRQRGGTGLGLTILKRQIELMGGALKLDSQSGQGSRFTFELPLSPAAGRSPAAPVAEGSLRLRPGASVRALVVDDVAANRDLLSRMLSMTGCEVEAVPDGESALRSARQHRPAIIFMDIWMPGMNGIEATQHLLREFRKTPVKIVAHSATAFSHEASKYLETGFEDFFPKPFRFERLCACLHSLLPDHFTTVMVPSDAPAKPPLPLAAVPSSIAEALRQAAQDYNITALKEGLERLKHTCPDQEAVSAELQTLIAAYDMHGIIAFTQQRLANPPPQIQTVHS